MADNQKEQAVKSQHTGSVAVDNLPKDGPITLEQLTEQIDSLSHHLDEPLPPLNNSSDQLVDYFENPNLETEQSLLSAVDNNTVSTTTTSVVDNKITSPVPDLETEQSLLSVVDKNITAPVIDVDNKSFTDETNKLISSIDDKVMEEVLTTEVLIEHKGDELHANETYINEKTESKDLESEKFVHVEDSEIATEIKSTALELSELIEDHYSKEVCVCVI